MRSVEFVFQAHVEGAVWHTRSRLVFYGRLGRREYSEEDQHDNEAKGPDAKAQPSQESKPACFANIVAQFPPGDPAVLHQPPMKISRRRHGGGAQGTIGLYAVGAK